MAGSPRIDWMQKMASRVSRIALPNRGYDVFGKLRERSVKRYGQNYGMANDPRKRMMPADQYLSTGVPRLPSSEDLDTQHRRNNFQTRTEIARQGAGMASLAPAINAAAMPPRPGIATDHHSSGMATSFSETGANANWRGSPAAMAAGNPQVEDAGWGQTMSQIVGSGMLSQEQLQAASFSNVLSMTRVDGGTDNDRREMAFYMQRMIMEGYIRGVDLVRDIKNEYGGSIRIQLTDGAVCSTTSTSIIGCGGMGFTQFRNSFWQNAGDGTKLALFYHEVGHEMLNRGHDMRPSSLMGYDRFNNSWQKDAGTYDALMDELYRNSSGVSKVSANNTPLTTAQADALIKANPDWFPSVSGVDPSGIGPNGNPNTAPPPGNTTNTTNNTTIIPPTVQPASAAGTIGASTMGGRAGTPEEASKTPVAGSLPDMASVHSFAAGLKDTMNRASPTLQGLAGALTRFKTG